MEKEQRHDPTNSHEAMSDLADDLLSHGRVVTDLRGRIAGYALSVDILHETDDIEDYSLEIREVASLGEDFGKKLLVQKDITPGGGQSETVIYDFSDPQHAEDFSKRVAARGALLMIRDGNGLNPEMPPTPLSEVTSLPAVPSSSSRIVFK